METFAPYFSTKNTFSTVLSRLKLTFQNEILPLVQKVEGKTRHKEE